MMLMATIVTMSCSSDNDGNETLSPSDKAQMYGRYDNLVTYGDNLSTQSMTVRVSEDHVTFNVPMNDILGSVLSSETGLDDAQATVRCNEVSESYSFVRYYNSIATFSLPTQNVAFTYTAKGAACTGSLKLTTPSFNYNTSTKKLVLGFTISSVTLNGKAVDSYKQREMYLVASEKKD